MLQVRVLSLRPKTKEGNDSFPLLLFVEVAEKRRCFELAAARKVQSPVIFAARGSKVLKIGEKTKNFLY
jgi:hypothetical protein